MLSSRSGTLPTGSVDAIARHSSDTCGVGFNPHRKHRRSPLDVVMVAAALAVCLALVVWAFLG